MNQEELKSVVELSIDLDDHCLFSYAFGEL